MFLLVEVLYTLQFTLQISFKNILQSELFFDKILYMFNNMTDMLKNKIIHADAIEALRVLPEDIIHLTFSSPPYFNARDYSSFSTYKDYLQFIENVFKNVYRITKEGRFCVVNSSPVLVPRAKRSEQSKRYPIPYDIHGIMTHIGWEFIDDIVWVKPEASVKNRNGSFSQHRKPLAYKTNAVTEMIMVYRKPTDKLIDWNLKQYAPEVVEASKVADGYETSNIWKISPISDPVHSAVFPIELCNRIVSYYSMIGDLVLDPFAGSGTLGLSALNLKRYFLLIEQHSEYINRIKDRLEKEDIFDNEIFKPKVISLSEVLL
jgi:DNA modification methylase